MYKLRKTKMKEKEWLVQIVVKDWICGDKHLAYEEVIATEEYYARNIAASQFMTRVQYEPIMRRIFEKRKLTHNDWCVHDAIEI